MFLQVFHYYQQISPTPLQSCQQMLLQPEMEFFVRNQYYKRKPEITAGTLFLGRGVANSAERVSSHQTEARNMNK